MIVDREIKFNIIYEDFKKGCFCPTLKFINFHHSSCHGLRVLRKIPETKTNLGWMTNLLGPVYWVSWNWNERTIIMDWMEDSNDTQSLIYHVYLMNRVTDRVTLSFMNYLSSPWKNWIPLLNDKTLFKV